MSKLRQFFSLKITRTKGKCATGDNYAKINLEEGKIPVLSCEGACIRGEIA